MTLFAQANVLPPVPWSTTATVALGLLGILMIIGSILWVWNQLQEARGKSKGTNIPQPLTVETVKALHEKFADKAVFEKHVGHNTERHGQIFASINRVEREAREALEKKFADLNEERSENIKHLNDQFTFIRESLVAVQTELKIRNES